MCTAAGAGEELAECQQRVHALGEARNAVGEARETVKQERTDLEAALERARDRMRCVPSFDSPQVCDSKLAR